MYHEVTYQETRRRRTRVLATCVAVALACVLALVGYRYAQRLSVEQGTATLRRAVVQSALQCCAVEGSFPSLLAHLKEHYGLTVNEDSYHVRYEWLGDNMAPSVVVMPK